MKQVCSLLLLLFTFTSSFAENSKTIYMFGVARSFNNDTTQYITFVEPVENATLQQGTKFLSHRSLYAAQLKQYVEQNYGPNQTCAIFFSTSRKKLEKKFLKVRREFYKKKPHHVVEITKSSFSFQPINL